METPFDKLRAGKLTAGRSGHRSFFREVQTSEFFTVFESCTVVGAGGGDFGIETAETGAFPVMADVGNPFA